MMLAVVLVKIGHQQDQRNADNDKENPIKPNHVPLLSVMLHRFLQCGLDKMIGNVRAGLQGCWTRLKVCVTSCHHSRLPRRCFWNSCSQMNEPRWNEGPCPCRHLAKRCENVWFFLSKTNVLLAFFPHDFALSPRCF